ncbi:MAG TPA: helix-turn-helix domain-containing protein [Solirubrobacteraceae bacterium]|nr:helix-turn-helix domain-containing protein [Solirubrobacteraceae bacterium]
MQSPQSKRPYRMATRAQAAAATRERLLAAAWRHFATRPYEDVLLREVAAEAGVTPQTLHARFGGKEQLFAVAYEWFARQEIAERPAVPTTDVRAAVAQVYDRYEQHGEAVLRMLSQEERIPAIRQRTDAGRAYHRRWAQLTFAPLLHGLRGNARERRLTAIVTATDLLVWKLLRHDAKLSRVHAELAVLELIQGPSSVEGHAG